MHDLIEELQRYHKEKARQLLDLERAALDLSEAGRSHRSRLLIKTLFEQFQLESEVAHHKNEELILCELLTTSAPIHRRVEEIAAEHKGFDRIVSNMLPRILSHSVGTAELCSHITGFIQLYDDHASGEEAIFFPIANQYLEDRHWKRVKDQWMP